MMKKSFIDKLVEQAGLWRVRKDIRSLLKESIQLEAVPGEGQAVLVGGSKLGGTPDLPPSVSWPEARGTPMAFVAQINLEEASHYSNVRGLPFTGLLSFFYDASQEVSGENPEDQYGWWVACFAPEESCVRAVFPDALPTPARYAPAAIHFQDGWTLPIDPREALLDLEWNETEKQRYVPLFQSFGKLRPRKYQHRVFGWPDHIQGDMRLQEAMLSHGVTSLDDARIDAVKRQRRSWQLLLQVDSDERLGMRWGSGGKLYFWIKTRDLRTRRFDRVRLILQSE